MNESETANFNNGMTDQEILTTDTSALNALEQLMHLYLVSAKQMKLMEKKLQELIAEQSITTILQMGSTLPKPKRRIKPLDKEVDLAASSKPAKQLLRSMEQKGFDVRFDGSIGKGRFFASPSLAKKLLSDVVGKPNSSKASEEKEFKTFTASLRRAGIHYPRQKKTVVDLPLLRHSWKKL